MTGKYSSSYWGDFESSEFESVRVLLYFSHHYNTEAEQIKTLKWEIIHTLNAEIIYFAVLILTQQTSGQSGTLTQLELIGRCIHELIGNYFFWSNMVCGPYIKKCVHSSAHHIAHRKFDEFFAGITLIK